MTAVRPAAVAGMFYPADSAELRATVRRLLNDVPAPEAPRPKAVIAPHAGYPFSGPLAARLYARLRPLRGQVRRVVLLGPAHRVPVRGLAVPSAAAFATPLGTVPVDEAARCALADLPQVTTSDAAHAQEHALEVHLPFLQEVLGDFALVPLVVGQAPAVDTAEVLERLWGGPETLIVVSSDLSHFLDYAAAQRRDARTVAAIERLDGMALGPEDACGAAPIAGLLTVARHKGLSIETVGTCNSGDTAGPRDRVVGYGAWALYEPAAAALDAATEGEAASRRLLDTHGADLLRVAAAAVLHAVRTGAPPAAEVEALPVPLRAHGAAFVTLLRDGDLRGCIGSCEAWRPLGIDVAENAAAAALRDPRFVPVAAAEVPRLALHVSVLSRPQPMAVRDEGDLLRRLRPGTDGLILADGSRRGVFLPAVWEMLPTAEAFLAQLKRKAGLAADHWSDTLEVARFTASVVEADSLLAACPA